jgi:hypothetical protein
MFVRLVSWIGNPSAMPCMYIMADSKIGLPTSRCIMHAYSAFHELAIIVQRPGDKLASTCSCNETAVLAPCIS